MLQINTIESIIINPLANGASVSFSAQFHLPAICWLSRQRLATLQSQTFLECPLPPLISCCSRSQSSGDFSLKPNASKRWWSKIQPPSRHLRDLESEIKESEDPQEKTGFFLLGCLVGKISVLALQFSWHAKLCCWHNDIWDCVLFLFLHTKFSK